jgi:hypothetical protein
VFFLHHTIKVCSDISGEHTVSIFRMKFVCGTLYMSNLIKTFVLWTTELQVGIARNFLATAVTENENNIHEKYKFKNRSPVKKDV